MTAKSFNPNERVRYILPGFVHLDAEVVCQTSPDVCTVNVLHYNVGANGMTIVRKERRTLPIERLHKLCERCAGGGRLLSGRPGDYHRPTCVCPRCEGRGYEL